MQFRTARVAADECPNVRSKVVEKNQGLYDCLNDADDELKGRLYAAVFLGGYEFVKGNDGGDTAGGRVMGCMTAVLALSDVEVKGCGEEFASDCEVEIREHEDMSRSAILELPGVAVVPIQWERRDDQSGSVFNTRSKECAPSLNPGENEQDGGQIDLRISRVLHNYVDAALVKFF